MTVDAGGVKAFILAALRSQLAAISLDAQQIPDDFDLRSSGVIDSLGFIQLLTALESHYGRSIDLSDLPPEELTHVGVLSAYIAGQIGSRTSFAGIYRDSAAR